MRSTEYSSALFVLTDGLFEQNDRSRIIDAVNNCVQSGMSTFGVGIGIEILFLQVIYSPNPSNTMKGHGGTRSELVADICQRSSIRDHLTIVTDGRVGTCSIDSSDSKMKSNSIKFKHVTTYAIGNGGDLSVGAPYSRGCPNVTYKVLRIGSEIPQSSLTAQDMATLNGISNISSYSEFAVQYKNLESAIQAKTLGTNGDAQLQGALNALSTRINNSGLNSSQKQEHFK